MMHMFVLGHFIVHKTKKNWIMFLVSFNAFGMVLD